MDTPHGEEEFTIQPAPGNLRLMQESARGDPQLLWGFNLMLTKH